MSAGATQTHVRNTMTHRHLAFQTDLSQRSGLVSCLGVSSARQRRHVCFSAATATPVAHGASCDARAPIRFPHAKDGMRLPRVSDCAHWAR